MEKYSGQSIKKLISRSRSAIRRNNHKLAISLTDEVLQRQSDHPAATAISFNSHFKLNNFEEARKIGDLAAELNPKSEYILNNQACLQLDAKQPVNAIKLLTSLVDQYGGKASWLHNLGLSYQMQSNLKEAIKSFTSTLDINPAHDKAAIQLAICQRLIGEYEKGLLSLDYCRLIKPKNVSAHNSYIQNAVMYELLTEEEVKFELATWQKKFIPNNKQYPISTINNKRKIKFGFIIGEIPSEWVSNVVLPVINQLARGKDEIIIYQQSRVLIQDTISSNVTVIVSSKLSDADFARKIRDDEIEILIDICGMHFGSRQRPLGLQVASKQFGWLAHVGSYADNCTNIIEDLIDYPFAYQKSDTALMPKESTLESNVILGLGCETGISSTVIRTWATILKKLPDHQLQLSINNSIIEDRISSQFNDYGVSSKQLLFSPYVSHTNGNLALDNFVYNDPCETTKAICDGYILVTLNGASFCTQRSANIVESLSKEEWVSNSISEYISKAYEFASTNPQKPVTEKILKKSKLHDVTHFSKIFRKALLKE